MDTPTTEIENVLDFASWIKENYPTYQFDENKRKLIKTLGNWATRNPKFNDVEHGYHIDRGILLVGAPGVGKDYTFRLLRKYLSYLRSPYGYDHRIVWEYAQKFKDQAYNCFNDVNGKNCYYEELARTDEGALIPTVSREKVQHFADKITIGVELINLRYNIFIQSGIQSHFSTNCNESMLLEVYGMRCVDRLKEMCNYIILPGASMRGKVAPQFVRNANDKMAPPPPRQTTVDEHKENIDRLEEEYAKFCESGEVSATASINYYILKTYGCALASDNDLRDIMDAVTPNYQAPLQKIGNAGHKEAWVLQEARKQAVVIFYTNMKKHGAKSLFGIVDAPLDGVVRKLVTENKAAQ